MKHLLLSIGLTALLLTSCGLLDLDGDGRESVEPVPLTLSAEQQAYVAPGNAFAVKLLAGVEKNTMDPGYFFSPFSYSTMMTMLLNGTQGEARAELAAALGYGESFDLDLVNDYCRQFIERAPTWDPKVSFSVANALVANQDYTIKAPFKTTLQESFSAEVSSRDFTKVKETTNYINDWCKKQTRNLIPKVLDTIESDEILFLINALYFKGDWAYPFKASETKDDDFFRADGSKQTVKMMHREFPFPAGKKGSAQVLEMPYGSGPFSMQFILPPLGEMAETIATIEKDGWGSFFLEAEYPGGKTDVFIPKFEQSCSIQDLALREAGIRKIFSRLADFSLICDKQLKIDRVIHVSSIRLDETGTEAAAVTTIRGDTAPSQQITSFRADHPFLYAIVEKTTGAIMFLGKYGGD